MKHVFMFLFTRWSDRSGYANVWSAVLWISTVRAATRSRNRTVQLYIEALDVTVCTMHLKLLVQLTVETKLFTAYTYFNSQF